ncbi:hypothetical protein HPB48_008145 [Haemaphysalis longicornis]|uniref:Uncharacterized protein n=1 Tax=Haemaphysalis longicornis TaxID=44386 RepID=A0A9J6GI47_HAELO|nr:hypothetical protein HPB48_008145 [Haemaphysalis longicornis]
MRITCFTERYAFHHHRFKDSLSNTAAAREAHRIRPRRPRSTTKDRGLFIGAAVNDKPFQSAKDNGGVLGLDNVSGSMKRLLTAADKAARVMFATEHCSCSESVWKLVAFSRESTFSSRGDQQRSVWRTEHTRFSTKNIQEVADSARVSVNV